MSAPPLSCGLFLCQLLFNPQKKLLHLLLHDTGVVQLAVKPYKCQREMLLPYSGNGFYKPVLMLSVCFPYLTLHPVSLYSPLELSLGNAHEHSRVHTSVCLRWGKNINDSDRESYHRATSRILEELLHGIASMQTLFLT